MFKINVFLQAFQPICIEMAPFTAHLTVPLGGDRARATRRPPAASRAELGLPNQRLRIATCRRTLFQQPAPQSTTAVPDRKRGQQTAARLFRTIIRSLLF